MRLILFEKNCTLHVSLSLSLSSLGYAVYIYLKTVRSDV